MSDIERFLKAQENDYDKALSERLIEISEALLDLESNDPEGVMGYPDDLKLKSSMTSLQMETYLVVTDLENVRTRGARSTASRSDLHYPYNI